jgi:hypothetical protein
MGTDRQTDVCTCGHTRAAHFQLKSQACMNGDCICEAFDKVDPVRAAAPELLTALKASYQEMVGLKAYLETCDESIIIDNLPALIDSLGRKCTLAEAAIRKAEGL